MQQHVMLEALLQAWIETQCTVYMDKDGLFQRIYVEGEEEALAVEWIEATSDLVLRPTHMEFLKIVRECQACHILDYQQ